MPFTPAHPAIVLPFIKWRYVSATGLIVGTISPDFEYFFKMSVDDIHGHTFLGIFYFDIPVTLFLSFLFHQLVKINLINNLPYYLQRRFDTLRDFNFLSYFKRHWVVFLISSIIGTALHILWDSFTHQEGFFVQHIHQLQDIIIPHRGARYPLWYVMQYAFSYIGMAIVIGFIVLMKPNQEATVTQPTFLYWIAISLIVAIVLFLRFYWLPETLDEGNLVVSLITALCIAFSIAGLFRFSNKLMIS